MMFARSLASFFVVSSFAVPAFAADYTVDPVHSKVGFTVRHLIGKVSGEFREFDAKFAFDAQKQTFGEAKIAVKANSIFTANDMRDKHLRSPDFFDVEKFPSLNATTGKIKTVGKNKFQWTTDLTMHGVTKPVVFDVEFTGAMKDMQGSNRVGFEAKTRINRKDFGLKWNKVLEAGGTVVGDDVDVVLQIEGVEQTKAAQK